MRLLDQVIQDAQPIRVRQGSGEQLCMPGNDGIAASLRACPLRYVLSDDTAAACTVAAFSPMRTLDACCDILRAPAPNVYVEFDQLPCNRLLAEYSNGKCTSSRQRIGLLAHCDSTSGRSGRIDLIWESLDGLPPVLCPLDIEFDFDRPLSSASEDLPSPPQQLLTLFAHVKLSLRSEWRDYYRRYAPNSARARDIVAGYARFIHGSFPIMPALFLMLAAKTPLRPRNSDYATLNAARAKRGKPPLVDHVELSLDLSAKEPAHTRFSIAGRSAPRLHLVRGHIMRRGDKVCWRSPHLRGKAVGRIATRTVNVLGP